MCEENNMIQKRTQYTRRY